MATTLDELIGALRFKLPDYLSELTGHEVVSGAKFKCINPAHDDSSPSMVMKDNTFCKCFGCGVALDIFSAVGLVEDKPTGGPEFVKDNVFYLADKFGIKYQINRRTDDRHFALKYAYQRAHRIVSDFIQETADQDPTTAFTKELVRRKWTKMKESIKFGLGCVHKFEDVLNVLRKNGFTDEAIKGVSLYRPDLFNSDNVIFTVYDESGRPIAFYARDVRYEEKRKEYLAQKENPNEILSMPEPKKYNSSSNFSGIYEKPLFPYGIHDIRTHHKIILVEGHGCKHSLKLGGINNVIALGGVELAQETVTKLSSLGVTHIVLCLDNDDAGKEKMKSTIARYYGKTSLDFSVIDMPGYNDVKDPDEFIRKYGIESFKENREKNAIEWMAIESIKDNSDPYATAKELASIIALERSSLNRLKIINSLVEFLVDSDDEKKDLRRAISEEVDQKISLSQDRKSEFALKMLDEAREMISVNPGALEAALNVLNDKLIDMDDNREEDELYSSSEVLRSVIKRKEVQESVDGENTVKFGFYDWDEVCPMPPGEAFVLIPAPPNSGKSSFLLTAADGIVNNNDNAMVIMFTNDDSRDIYIDRMIALKTKLKINWIANPKKYLDADKMNLRNQAYHEISEQILHEKIIFKDITHANNVEYIGKLIAYYRNKYPDRNIVCTCDNLHRLETALSIEEGRHKVKYISGQMKSYTTKFNCIVLATVEMTKENMYEKPKDARAIAEAAALQFDANLIIFLWNELNVMREEAQQIHKYNSLEYVNGVGYVVKEKIGPVIEVLFLKNKLSEFKEQLFFKLYPELARFDDMAKDEVETMLENVKQAKVKRIEDAKAARAAKAKKKDD